MLGAIAPVVGVEIGPRVPEPLKWLDEPAGVEWQQGARVGLLVRREAVRAGPVLTFSAADANSALDAVDLLGLDHARGFEQGADNEAALVAIVDMADIGLHPAPGCVVILVAPVQGSEAASGRQHLIHA